MKKKDIFVNKKVTVKDVAMQAGVSVATVSYIMNNRTDQKISDATRKKVLQIANLLNYTPNYAAKSLATGRNNIIGISYRLNPLTPSRNLEITNFVNLLIERLNRLKYDVLFMPIKATQDNIPVNRNIDAILTIDLSKKEFKELADAYFVPIINIDMLVNDNLFFQIYSDIPYAIQKAINKIGDEYILVTENYGNENYFDFIVKDIPKDKLYIISNPTEINYEILKDKKIIVLGSYLGLLLMPHINHSDIYYVTSGEDYDIIPDNSKRIIYDVSKKANITINILMNALDRRFDLSHDQKI